MNMKHAVTVGRTLQTLEIAGPGDSGVAFASARNWLDRDPIAHFVKAVISPLDSDDFPTALVPVADAFLSTMRPYSIPLRLLEKMRRTVMFTRIYANAATGEAIEVAPGEPLPILRGDWSTIVLTPRTFGAITIATSELVRSTSAVASAGLADDLAGAVAEAENRAFLDPSAAGSVLDGAPFIESTGTTDEAIGDDLRRLFGLVRGDGRGGLALVMSEQTAAHVHFSDPSKFPSVGPEGGSIAGVPVLISSVCASPGSPTESIVAVVNAAQVFWSDRGRVELSTSREAALQLTDEPSAGATNVVSLLQSDSVALKGVRESSWYARAGAGAFLRVPF